MGIYNIRKLLKPYFTSILSVYISVLSFCVVSVISMAGKNAIAKELDGIGMNGMTVTVYNAAGENITDDTEIRNTIKTIIENNPESVADYKNGHDRAIKYLMGQVMKETKGKANPKMAMDILTEELQ